MTNETQSFVADFRDLLTTFADGGVEFVLIGGWAMALHGHGRGTDDLDVLVRPTPENAKLVFQALVRRPKDLADVDWLERHTEDQ